MASPYTGGCPFIRCGERAFTIKCEGSFESYAAERSAGDVVST
ncbi:hypothetical protein [Paenibacillus marchantiophytorum]|nr:hypothetical protein [Paenibacillus marchantiophytorum]